MRPVGSFERLSAEEVQCGNTQLSACSVHGAGARETGWARSVMVRSSPRKSSEVGSEEGGRGGARTGEMKAQPRAREQAGK